MVVGGFMSQFPERNRVGKSDISNLVARLQAALGPKFSVEFRDGGSFIAIFDLNKILVATYQWVQGVGWRASIMQPFTFCFDDIDHVVEELRRSLEGCDKILARWETFHQSKTEKAWQAYQGVRATHNFRMYHTQPEPEPKFEPEPEPDSKLQEPDIDVSALLNEQE